MICFSALALVPSWAAGLPISTDAEVDRNQITLGDIITYTVTIRHDTDLKPSAPDFSSIEGFDLLESDAGYPREVEGQIEQEFSVQLRADIVGPTTIPPLPIPFETVQSEGEKIVPGEIKTPEVTVEVQSVLRMQGEPSDIRDIKDAVDVGRNWTPWIFAGLNLLLVLIILYLFWKYRTVKSSAPVEKPFELAPHEKALRELDILKRKGLLDQGDAYQHFFELSEIFRRYLGWRYRFPAPDWTTEEITVKFSSLPGLETQAREEAVRILIKSDLIKFARVEAAPGHDEIESVRKLIESTREHKVIGLYAE